jgi:hypothetical protein
VNVSAYEIIHNPLSMKIKRCLNCSKALSGRQTKFCSRTCKNTHNNLSFQSYQAQQIRGRKRKLQLIEIMGGQCGHCHYKKNFSALEFHHKNPKTKLFQLDLRSLSNRRWEAIEEEAKKCLLLCSNCHAELHNPDCII